MELMVTLAIAGVVLGIGAPSFRDFLRNNRLTSAANDFLAATQVARTEAIKRQQPVSVCPTDDPTDPAAGCVAGDFNSWIIFVDLNSDCDRAAGAGEIILASDGPVGTGVSSDSDGSCISFAPTGFLQPEVVTGVPPATQTVYCDSRGLAAQAGTTQSAGRGIFVTNTGRSRVSRDITSGSAAQIDTWGRTCP
jgi:type IV fimbrial biogenesis protein FimT